jgi:hypothetical protein
MIENSTQPKNISENENIPQEMPETIPATFEEKSVTENPIDTVDQSDIVELSHTTEPTSSESEPAEDVVEELNNTVETPISATISEVVATAQETTEESAIETSPENVIAQEVPSTADQLNEETLSSNATLQDDTLVESEVEPAVNADIQTEVTSNESSQNNTQEEQYSEEEEEDDDDDDEHVDYSKFDKGQLYSMASEMARFDDVLLAYKSMSAILPYITAIYESEKQAAFDKYIAEGGEPDGFEFRDEPYKKIEALYKEVTRKRKQFNEELYKEKERNFKLKAELLDKLRKLSEQEDSKQVFEQVKEIQNQWKAIGPVHGPQSESLYKSYHTLIDMYYTNHSIYRELIELDRKHNLQAKKEVIAQAKALLDMPFKFKLIKQLNALQDEFRSIGPVPNDKREEVWNEFKQVCDQLYERRKQYLEEQKVGIQKEIELKTVLVERAKLYEQYHSDKAIDWINTSKEVQALQEDWKNSSHKYQSKTEELKKQFWHSYKKFFNNKNQFFKQLEAERKANLKLKEALCEKAESLQDSEDFDAAAEELKQLQAEWKTIGPVPTKQKDIIWERFRKAMDSFFERKRGHSEAVINEYKANLKAKEEICEKLVALSKSGDAKAEDINTLIEEFQNIGFVPFKEIAKISSKFVKSVDAAIENSKELTDKEKVKLRASLLNKVGKNNPEVRKSFQKQETNINRRIAQLAHDISVWKTNLEFFGKSKNAQALKDEFNKKIQLAELELKELKEQQKILTK